MPISRHSLAGASGSYNRIHIDGGDFAPNDRKLAGSPNGQSAIPIGTPVMKRCPYCGTRLEYEPDSCPNCLRALHQHQTRIEPVVREPEEFPRDDEPMRAIARFTNAAEAGFFAHTLSFAEEIPASIRAEDNFDGVAGYWSTRYHLEVPESMAASASRRLQSIIDRSEREDFIDDLTARPDCRHEDAPVSSRFVGFDDQSTAEESSGMSWGPIVLTLAAGSLAFVGFRAIQPALQPRAEVPAGRQKNLWDQLSHPSKPWVQKLEGNRRREVRFNADGSRATIREYAGDEKVNEREFAVPAEKN